MSGPSSIDQYDPLNMIGLGDPSYEVTSADILPSENKEAATPAAGDRFEGPSIGEELAALYQGGLDVGDLDQAKSRSLSEDAYKPQAAPFTQNPFIIDLDDSPYVTQKSNPDHYTIADFDPRDPSKKDSNRA